MIEFTCHNPILQQLFDAATRGLAANVRLLEPNPAPLLIEGSWYLGVWLECAPMEGLLYAPFSPQTASNNHRIFFAHQRSDGQFPAMVRSGRAGFGQIQQTVPIAETALELALLTGDEELLIETRRAASAWDAWLSRHRDSGKRNLCELFCEFDTGHDHSSRFPGIPQACPEKEAANLPNFPGLPYLAPDLSATLYGGRIALSRIASLLGDNSGSELWRERAEATRKALFQFCYDPETEFFYDRDAFGNLRKIPGDAGLRVLMEHLPDQELADRIFQRWVLNPDAFWTPWPIPSIAASAPEFLHPAPDNCWGGPSQALLALRAPRWFEFYGKYAALAHLMHRWLEALGRAAGVFRQQMDPFSGEFSTGVAYSPAMLCAVEFTTRLAGIRETPDELFWYCNAAEFGECRFRLDLLRGGSAELVQKDGNASLRRNGREILHCRGNAILVTDRRGGVLRLHAPAAGNVEIALPDGTKKEFSLQPDQTVALSSDDPSSPAVSSTNAERRK